MKIALKVTCAFVKNGIALRLSHFLMVLMVSLEVFTHINQFLKNTH